MSLIMIARSPAPLQTPAALTLGSFKGRQGEHSVHGEPPVAPVEKAA